MRKWKVKVLAEITVDVSLKKGCDLALETTNLVKRDFGGKVIEIIKCNQDEVAA